MLGGTGGEEKGLLAGVVVVGGAVHSALCFPGPASSRAWPGPCSHRGWLSALTLITVYLSDWHSHNSPGPLITEAAH